MLSIWFFIGLLLLAYGVIIMGAGIAELVSGTSEAAASPLAWPGAAKLYPSVWWGALMTIMGAVYTLRFRPKKGNGNE